MPIARTIPTLAILALLPIIGRAQGPADAPVAAPPAAPAVVEPPTEAELLLDAAIKKVAALPRVSADLTEKIEMLSQDFSLKGRYIKDTDHRIYFKLALDGLGDSPGTMLQVCDGTILWDFQQVLNAQSYRKLEIAPILKRLETNELEPELREQILTQLGFAGPDALLVGLRKAVRFNQKEVATLDGRAVTIIRGEWKDRTGLVGPNQQPLPPTAPLPAYIPSLVAIWLGTEDGWPYKVELVGKKPSELQADNRRIGPDGRPIGRKAAAPSVKPSRVTLVYSNVNLAPETKPEDFAFQAPPGATVEDATKELVGQLDVAVQRTAAERKKAAEAAPATLIPPTTPVPIPAAAPAPAASPG